MNTPNWRGISASQGAGKFALCAVDGKIVLGPGQCCSSTALPVDPYGYRCFSAVNYDRRVRTPNTCAPSGSYVQSLHACCGGPKGIKVYEGYVCW